MISGAIIINKEEGLTSQAVVNRVKRLFSEAKAGHTGTLDPLATGVLPVLLGRGVKASEYMLTEDKHYIATLRLGLTTDTEDVTGNILSSSDIIPTEAEVIAATNSFVGEIMQVPPMYSALKISGKKLCDLAREGKTVEREARKITVYKIDVSRVSDTDYTLNVHCSKGTYIRTLCADIGEKLGCGGVMAALCRSEVSGFTLKDAYTLGELEEMSYEKRLSLVVKTENLFRNERGITLEPFFARLARCGVEIYLKKIKISLKPEERVKLFDEKGFFALGEVREFDGELAIKPIKQFDV